MKGKITIEEEPKQLGSVRVIKIDGVPLGDACPCCGRGGVFEFPFKRMAENYVKQLKNLYKKQRHEKKQNQPRETDKRVD